MVRVLVIDDEDAVVFRDRLLEWGTLRAEDDRVEIETTLTGVRAVLAVDKELPDLIVLDGYFPEHEDGRPQFNADEVMDLLARHPPDQRPKVLFVSGHPDIQEHWEQIVRWLDTSRIADVLPKDLGELTSLLLTKRIDLLRESLALKLSTREIQVLRLLYEGASNKEIARQLAIDPSTVGTHLEHIFHRLGVSNRTAAATKAMRLGLAHRGESDADRSR